MADKYCDHGAYGAYNATPTWGVPQDGDGLAKLASTASAIASIVFTGIPAGTISVCGVTVSPTWATSADVSANNLATAINAATGNVTTTGFRAAAVQLRNAVFARGPAGGAPAGTCQIMTRHGSAVFDGLTAIAHTLTNVDAGASALAFSGGVSGCWGYFTNIANLWASAVGPGSYGLISAALPFSGSAEPGDVIKVRAAKTITFAQASLILAVANIGTALAPVTIEIDDGTEWPADGSTPVLTIATNSSAASTWTLSVGSADCYVHIKAAEYAGGSKNFIISAAGASATSPIVHYGGPAKIENLALVSLTTGGCPLIKKTNAGANGAKFTTLLNCRSEFINTTNPLMTPDNAINPGRIDIIGHLFVASAQSAPINYVVSNFGAAHQRIRLIACSFDGFVSGTRLLPISSSLNLLDSGLTAVNTNFGNVNVLGPNYLTTTFTGNLANGEPGTNGLYASSQFGYREFVYERPGKLYSEWVQSKGRPTLNAVLFDGVTPWSIFSVPTSVSGNISKSAPVDCLCINKILPAAVDLAEASRTFTVNLLIESTLSWTKADLSVVITYVTTAGEIKTISSYDHNASSLDSSTAAWSATTWNGQTWLKRQFSITTPDEVAAESEVTAMLLMHTTASNETIGIIYCPEIIVA